MSDDMYEDPSVYALNPEEDERASAELLDPAGWYITDPTTASFTRTTNDAGRTIWIVTALAEHSTGTKARLRARLSPEKGPDDVADFTYRMYNDPKSGLRSAYKAIIGDSPTSDKHLEDFVTNYPVRMRLVRTGVDRNGQPLPDKQPDTLVVAFGAPRGARS